MNENNSEDISDSLVELPESGVGGVMETSEGIESVTESSCPLFGDAAGVDVVGMVVLLSSRRRSRSGSSTPSSDGFPVVFKRSSIFSAGLDRFSSYSSMLHTTSERFPSLTILLS